LIGEPLPLIVLRGIASDKELVQVGDVDEFVLVVLRTM
jgi:hypothetical protein